MEAALRKYGHDHGDKLNFEEKKAAKSSTCDDLDGCSEEIGLKVGNGRKEIDYKTNIIYTEQADLLESTKAEMGEVIEENHKLRTYLEQIMKEYQALQMKFRDVVQQETTKPSSTSTSLQEEEGPEFVSLCLGRSSSGEMKKQEDMGKNCNKEKVDDEEDKEGLALALDSKFEVRKTEHTKTSSNPSSEASLEEIKEAGGESSGPSQQGVKTTRPVDDEVSQQNPTKRARVSVRVRCDTPTMNDGCQWRKYGQKIAKGNPCPRAYYRCTVAPNCPVRKQVQRCADDMTILTTTYEGTHSHPLPISATAMASTTSAAASMLLSGSTTSGTASSTSATTTFSSSNLNNLNFYLSSNNSKPNPPFYIPNSSISSSPSYPTITIDLTTNPSAAAHLNKMNNFPPRYSSTNLNFSSMDSSSLPMSWSNGMLNYGNQPYNYKNNQVGSLSFGRHPQENLYQTYMQKGILNSSTQQQSLPADTIAAATKAITSDPSFQSALAAALTSIIGSGGSNTNGTHVAASASAAAKSDQNSSANSLPGSLMLMSSKMPFSTSNTKSTSPADKRDHNS